MKKVFVMMILILSFMSINGQSITINSATLSNNDGVSSYIPGGEYAKVDFSFSATDANTPINFVIVRINSSSEGSPIHETNVVNSITPTLEGLNGNNQTSSFIFLMPTLSGDAVDDTNFFLELRLADLDFNVSNIFETSSISYIDNTLPVELSAFNAVATADNFVNISWTVQSETNISGYFIIRGLQNNIETAEMIPAFINATNGTQEHSYNFTDQEVTPNNIYFYWLQSVEFSLQTELFGPIMVEVGEPTGGEVVPADFGTQLIGNYPNPFNPSTSVSFSVANPSNVRINIYNVKGQLVKNLYNSFVPANKTNQRVDVLWNGKDNKGQSVSSGVYYTKMIAGNHTEFKKMLMVK